MPNERAKAEMAVGGTQQLIVDMVAVEFLLAQPDQAIVIPVTRVRELLAKFTVRLELVSPEKPEESDIKVSVVTMEEALKLAKAMQGVKQVARRKP